jgi:hypothetical protein
MEKLKERKTPSQSRRKLITMINLFEKYVDEEIKFIDVRLSRIQTSSSLYDVNIHTNKVEERRYDWYELKSND